MNPSMMPSLEMFIQSHSTHYVLLEQVVFILFVLGFFGLIYICDHHSVTSYYKLSIQGLIRVTMNTGNYEALHPGIITKSLNK